MFKLHLWVSLRRLHWKIFLIQSHITIKSLIVNRQFLFIIFICIVFSDFKLIRTSFISLGSSAILTFYVILSRSVLFQNFWLLFFTKELSITIKFLRIHQNKTRDKFTILFEVRIKDFWILSLNSRWGHIWVKTNLFSFLTKLFHIKGFNFVLIDLVDIFLIFLRNSTFQIFDFFVNFN